MKSWLRAAGAVSAFVLGLAALPAHAEQQTLSLELREVVGKLIDSDMKACKALNGRLMKAVNNPEFDRQNVRERGYALYAVIACAPAGSPQGLDAARRLAPIARDAPLVYIAQLTLMSDAQKRKAPADYIDGLDKIIAADPAQLAEWEPRDFAWIRRNVRDEPAQELRLLTLLHTVPWTSQDSRDADQNARAVRLAQLLAEGHGDMTKAGILLEGVTSPGSLAAVAQDRRFETLWPALEKAGRFDWTKVVETDLAAQRKRMADDPKSLAPAIDVIDSLRALGRYDEALAVAETYAARLRKGQAFTDGEDQRAWLFNAQAYTLFDVGRFDEADAAFKGAGGEDSVSQNVNRAQLLINAGHPAEALKVIGKAKPEQSSAYGLMWVDAVRTCAQADLGDKAAAEAGLAAMRARGKENASALTQVLLCLDARDEAAALYVQRLKDPAERANALEAFRVTRPPKVVPPVAAALEARKAAVLARPDVQAALKAHGRAVTLPLAGNYWGAI